LSASGCGKSTLVGLIERWYEPGSGYLVLDGMDISEYNTEWLRSNIRPVQQEHVLFRGSVFENVAKGLVGEQLDLSHGEIMQLVQEACKISNAHDFIQQLPNVGNSDCLKRCGGLTRFKRCYTELGERASRLSGGQRQRIATARSIISNPKILLLDEATSALDAHAEREVQCGLSRASRNRTVLAVAHKLAIVKDADNIVVISEGRAIEQGTYEQLVTLDGHYAALLRA